MLYGNEIYLREMVKEDIDILYKLCVNEDVLKYNGDKDGIVSKMYLKSNFKYFNKPSKKYYVIVNHSGNIIGMISYRNSRYCEDIYSVSITIGREYWNKGYGQDSMKTLLKYLFNKKKAHKVELEVVKENIAAIMCYKKCGFTEEGIRRQKYYCGNQYLDTVLMGILYDEYKNLRS